MRIRAAPLAAALFAAAALSSCYEAAQASRYVSLLLKARPAAKALADPALPAEERTFLERVAAIRAFAVSEIGLRETKNYGSIVELDADRLVTVVSACAELSFDTWLWSYPVVGKLPYRGYFDPKGAEAEAARLKKLGLDVISRPVDAFSSLGWLPDPLFSFMASYGEADLADTIIHEMTHASAFAKASASRPEAGNFNEELATFVGRRGALLWLESSHGTGSKQVEDALRDRVDRAAFASWLAGTAAALQAIYSRSIESAEKRRLKAEIISARAAEFEVAYDALFETTAYRGFPMGKLNNAYLDLYRLYEGESALYEDYLSRICGSSLRRFVAAMSRIASGKTDPKAGMRAELAAGAPR